ncbi:hypothetical protein QF048_005283 [Streptomyces sp. W4I9-2]|nr:hypothetical protein [Streptomyces sp. W4I9-2]
MEQLLSDMPETPATAEAEETRDPDTPPAARNQVRNWSAAGGWGFALGVGYAVLVRFYHAAGGEIGVAGKVSEQYVATLHMVSYLTGLVILVGAGACLVLAYRQFRVFPRWVPRVGGTEAPHGLVRAVVLAPALFGGTYAIGHWMTGTLTKILDLTGVITVEISEAWVTRDRVAGDLWEIFFYEPWFLAMGACLVLSGLQYARDSGVSRRAVRIVGTVMLVSALALFLYGTLLIVMGWEFAVI